MSRRGMKWMMLGTSQRSPRYKFLASYVLDNPLEVEANSDGTIIVSSRQVSPSNTMYLLEYNEGSNMFTLLDSVRVENQSGNYDNQTQSLFFERLTGSSYLATTNKVNSPKEGGDIVIISYDNVTSSISYSYEFQGVPLINNNNGSLNTSLIGVNNYVVSPNVGSKSGFFIVDSGVVTHYHDGSYNVLYVYSDASYIYGIGRFDNKIYKFDINSPYSFVSSVSIASPRGFEFVNSDYALVAYGLGANGSIAIVRLSDMTVVDSDVLGKEGQFVTDAGNDIFYITSSDSFFVYTINFTTMKLARLQAITDGVLNRQIAAYNDLIYICDENANQVKVYKRYD